jgi:hypothetical protein
LTTGPNLDLVSGRDLDRVHVGIREHHTGKKDLVSGRDLVNFGPNLFGYQMAPNFVIYLQTCHFYLPATQHKTTPVSPFPPDATQGNHQNKEVGAIR